CKHCAPTDRSTVTFPYPELQTRDQCRNADPHARCHDVATWIVCGPPKRRNVQASRFTSVPGFICQGAQALFSKPAYRRRDEITACVFSAWWYSAVILCLVQLASVKFHRESR